MSPTGPRARRRLGALLAALAPTILLVGCSDDVVCPIDTTPDVEPFISARIVEAVLARGDTTWVEVYATADSLPTLLFVSINDRQIDDVAVDDDFGLVVSLEEDVIVWQPGTQCSLRVTTNYGFAASSEPVPSAFEVSAPETIPLGDSLALSWTAADGADYYVLRGTLEGGGTGDEINATVRDTAVTIGAGEIPFAGVIRGHVEAVAGPFPEIGSAGNIGGAGWGFFTIAYHGPASTFEVTVADTGSD